MKKITKIINITCLWLSISLPTASQAMIVYDPANWSENVITAAQSQITAAKSALIESHTLETVANTYKTYKQVAEQYKLLAQNLQQLAHMDSLISPTKDMINTENGHSDLSKLSQLNPRDSHYEQKRDKVLSDYFRLPLDIKKLEAKLRDMLPIDQLEAITKQVKTQWRDYKLLRDAIDQASEETQKSIKRIGSIKNFQTILSHLGSTSLLKTAQTTAAEINVMLQQHEQLIQQYNEVLKYVRLQAADLQSARAEQTQAEQKTLQKSLLQGGSGLGRDRWGRL